jgi:hypothetical protein
MEKDINKCFNKSLLEDENIIASIQSKIKDLLPTNKKSVPFFISTKNGKIPVLNGIKAVTNMVNNQYEEEVALILLFDSSNIKNGISKRTGNEYSFLKIVLNDGYSIIEGVWWDKMQPLRYAKDSIVFLKGKVKEGWDNKPAITISTIERII